MFPLDVWGNAGYFARSILVILGALAALLPFIVVERWLAFRQLAGASGPQLHKHLHALAAIRTSAPMLGFLGTLLGVINMLAGVAMTGAIDLRSFGAGMAEALLMTVLGLLVGLPAWWAHGYFTARAERMLAGV
jgi:biopolymer transport protein ExbB/TolQ